MHNWPSLLPQLRMEYMQRRHAVTGYSPDDLVFATPVRLPPPVGPLNWEASAAPIAFGCAQASFEADAYLAGREKRAAKLLAADHDRILKAQSSNADQQATRLAAQRRRGKKLLEGDLAYLLQPTGLKNTVKGPYVVVKVGEASLELCTPDKVQGQQSKHFSVNVERVARCTAVVDALDDLLCNAGMRMAVPKVKPDELVRHHERRSWTVASWSICVYTACGSIEGSVLRWFSNAILKKWCAMAPSITNHILKPCHHCGACNDS